MLLSIFSFLYGVLCIIVCLFVLLTIVLFVLRFTVSDYSFDVFHRQINTVYPSEGIYSSEESIERNKINNSCAKKNIIVKNKTKHNKSSDNTREVDQLFQPDFYHMSH
jgi:hypothetical protein